jgi:hypothetical protein
LTDPNQVAIAEHVKQLNELSNFKKEGKTFVYAGRPAERYSAG